MNSEIKIKHCSVCDQNKPIDQFRLKKDQRKGKAAHFYYLYLCIECQSERDKKYRVKNRFFLEENRRLKNKCKPLIKKTKKTFRKNSDVCKDRYYANHELCKQKSREYYYANKEVILERRKIKYIENKKNKRRYPGSFSQYKRAKDPHMKQRERIIGRIILSNQYVKKLINQSVGLKLKNIPPDLVESYRMQIKVKRLIKQKKDENIKTS